jgi:hypothetical protein
MENKNSIKGQVDHETLVNHHPKNQKLKMILSHENKINEKKCVKMAYLKQIIKIKY